MTGPDEDDWQALCAEAEEAYDADPRRFEEQWLPTALIRLADWPATLRRCPDRWFRRPGPGVPLLLTLGAVTPADLAGHPPHQVRRPDSPGVVPGGDVEFSIPGDGSGPAHAGLQVAWFVRTHWPEIERVAEDVLNEVAADYRDPYALGRVPAGCRRFESSGIVTIDDPPAFTVECTDNQFTTNGWPYGHWRVDFERGAPVGVRLGTDSDNIPYWGGPSAGG